ncbi:MAG TPA: MFS transporter [Nitrolancea sp.]|nr:MFS transporter [Nitrolancea sp.]
MARRPGLGLSRDNQRIFVAMACNEGAFGIYTTLWPLYIAALGATPPEIGLVMGFMGLARLLALLPSGLIADRVPPRRLIVGGRSLTVAGMFLLALAQNWWQLIPAAMILTLGNVAFPSISSTIAESAEGDRERTRAFTMIYTVGPSITLLATPALGGLIADQVGLRAVFAVAAALTGVAVLAFGTITPRPVPAHDGPPATFGEVLAIRPIALIAALEFVTLFILSLGVTLVPNFLQDVHGINTGVIGLLGSFSAVGSIILGIMISRLRPLQRPLAAVALSSATVALSLALLSAGNHLAIFALAYALRGGFSVAWSLFSAAYGEVAPRRLHARTFALGELSAGLGFSSAPFLAGWLYDLAPVAPLLLALGLAVPLLAAILLVERALRRPRLAVAETV